MASPVMKRVAFTFGLGSTVPLYFYLSDSQSTFYKYALKIGKVVTEGDAEFAHKAGVFLAKHSIVPHDKIGNDKILGVKLWGLNFPNPIGLAAVRLTLTLTLTHLNFHYHCRYCFITIVVMIN
jgi:hypothetical protein